MFKAFVVGHEARVVSAKVRAASESSGSRPSATDRLRLLRERVAAKQTAGLACTSEGPSGGGGPGAPFENELYELLD